jgi:hypothetical protein
VGLVDEERRDGRLCISLFDYKYARLSRFFFLIDFRHDNEVDTFLSSSKFKQIKFGILIYLQYIKRNYY